MRYAIYFSPPDDDPLCVLAAQWLGRDAFRNEILPQPELARFTPAEHAELTADPRRYGFHATLKAPFFLADDRSESDLVDSFDSFAASTHPADIDSLVLGQIGPFFALVPRETSAELQALADACVRHFEPFRASLNEVDIRRRDPENLSPPQRRHLEQWGYPYVFEEFRFHMTLTGQVPEVQRDTMREELERCFEAHLGQPLRLSHLALFVEREPRGPFEVLRIRPLHPEKLRNTA